MADDLYRHFGECVDLIHNPFYGVNYRDVILPLLFYKIASDTYRDRYQEVEEEVGPEVAGETVWYRVGVPPGQSWEEACESEGSLARSVLEGYEKLSNANLNSFGEILPIDVHQLQKLEDGRLKSLVDHISSRNLSRERHSPAELGPLFQELILNLHSLSTKNRPLPSEEMSRLLAYLITPVEASITIHDPMCGVGTLLAEVADAARKSKDTDLGSAQFDISGQEGSPVLAQITRMNLYAWQVDCRIETGGIHADLESENAESHQRFDCVLSGTIPANTVSRFSPHRNRQPELNDWTYDGNDPRITRLIHGITRMKAQGRGAFITSEAFWAEDEAAGLREYLVANDMIEAIVGFPEDYREEGSKRSVLLIDKTTARNAGEIFFLKADDSFFRSHWSDEKRLSTGELERLNSMVKRRIEEEGISRVVSTDEIESEGGTLKPEKYLA